MNDNEELEHELIIKSKLIIKINDDIEDIQIYKIYGYIYDIHRYAKLDIDNFAINLKTLYLLIDSVYIVLIEDKTKGGTQVFLIDKKTNECIVKLSYYNFRIKNAGFYDIQFQNNETFIKFIDKLKQANEKN